MSRAHRTIIAAATLMAAVAIGITDVSIGNLPEITIFALIPIIAGTYYLGFRFGLSVATVAAVTELAAHEFLEAGVQHAELIVITASHTFIYLLTAALIDRLVKQLRIITSLEEQRSSDLDLAKRIHSSVFSPVPDRHGDLSIGSKVAFANELGGDYYHIAGLDEGLFFCIADISGKSTAAALFTAVLNQSVTEALGQGLNLTTFVAAVNSRMGAALPEDMFITMFCALISGDRLAYVNAGHPPPLIYSKAAGNVKLVLSNHALPIGIVPDLNIEAAMEPFEPGDYLLAMTDGVTESPAFRDQPYEKLTEILMQHNAAETQDLVGVIYSRTLTGIAQILPDDVVVVSIKRDPSS